MTFDPRRAPAPRDRGPALLLGVANPDPRPARAARSGGRAVGRAVGRRPPRRRRRGCRTAAASPTVEPELPYLLKLLSAVEPLSLQAHPDAEQARAGFAEEEAAGTAYAAANRTYKDANAKPEMHRRAHAVRRAVRVPRSRRRAAPRGRAELSGARRRSSRRWTSPNPTAALTRAFTAEMTGWRVRPGEQRLAPVAGAAASRAADPATDPDDSVAYGWLARLRGHASGDAGALAPLLLNRGAPRARHGVFLPAGNLHAYLAGAGVEIMGNSDNVVRGGLTPKHVDVPRLLDIVEFTPQPVPVVRPRRVTDGLDRYDVPVEQFSLHRVSLRGEPVTVPVDGPRVVLCTAGVVEVWVAGGSVPVSPGRAAYVGSDAGPLVVGGDGTAFRRRPRRRAGRLSGLRFRFVVRRAGWETGRPTTVVRGAAQHEHESRLQGRRPLARRRSGARRSSSPSTRCPA